MKIKYNKKIQAAVEDLIISQYNDLKISRFFQLYPYVYFKNINESLGYVEIDQDIAEEDDYKFLGISRELYCKTNTILEEGIDYSTQDIDHLNYNEMYTKYLIQSRMEDFDYKDYKKIMKDTFRLDKFISKSKYQFKYFKILPNSLIPKSIPIIIISHRLGLDDFESNTFDTIPVLYFVNEKTHFQSIYLDEDHFYILSPDIYYNAKSINLEPSAKKLLIIGLEMGLMAQIVSAKSHVTSITIIEEDIELIKYYKDVVSPQIKNNKKINIIHVKDYLNCTNEINLNVDDYDCVISNLYNISYSKGVKYDLLFMYKLLLHLKTNTTKITNLVITNSWEIISELKLQVLYLYYESIESFYSLKYVTSKEEYIIFHYKDEMIPELRDDLLDFLNNDAINDEINKVEKVPNSLDPQKLSLFLMYVTSKVMKK